jgi:hypothetical protein
MMASAIVARLINSPVIAEVVIRGIVQAATAGNGVPCPVGAYNWLNRVVAASGTNSSRPVDAAEYVIKDVAEGSCLSCRRCKNERERNGESRCRT